MNKNKLTVLITSFSYKKGLPAQTSEHGGGFVFDCRCIPNPGREERFKNQTGLDKGVIDFLENNKEAQDFFKQISNLIFQAASNYSSRDFSSLLVNFGCTGGQHRSVYFTEKLASFLKSKGLNTEVLHRDIPKDLK